MPSEGGSLPNEGGCRRAAYLSELLVRLDPEAFLSALFFAAYRTQFTVCGLPPERPWPCVFVIAVARTPLRR